MGILSIQSHVAFGYVGNKAAVYPLQNLGYDVWPVNTVQFSNHTGYGKWQGEVFSHDHIRQVITGIEEMGQVPHCEAILSGYLGSSEIGACIRDTVVHFKMLNQNIIYLCDPVIGDVGRGMFVTPAILDYFRLNLLGGNVKADIITPNHFEAEILTGQSISSLEDAKKAASAFHQAGVKIVIITSFRIDTSSSNRIHVFLSEANPAGENHHVVSESPFYDFSIPPNGTGDLFSALYLGNYLRFKDAEKALRCTLTAMESVMENTYGADSRELKVTSVSYAEAD